MRGCALEVPYCVPTKLLDNLKMANVVSTFCKACQSSGPHTAHVFREMMFGTHDLFDYFECGDCGSIQRFTQVEDEGKFYPSNYYSFWEERQSFRSRITAVRDAHALHEKSIAGYFLNRLWPLRDIKALEHLNLTTRTKILDVGCGSASLLHRLARAGFQNLTGVDPFVKVGSNSNGVKVIKSDIQNVDGRFDLIMFNHSLEHVLDPAETLRAARRLLSNTGRCLIRVPTCSSFAWKHYGKNWVQLDAPRHTVIFSRQGLSNLATRVGFRLDETIDDATDFQFWGSEMYCRDIALMSKPIDEIFSQKQFGEFRERAKELNSKGLGDQAAFIISPI
jgi:SAM-dependent methyltransferase